MGRTFINFLQVIGQQELRAWLIRDSFATENVLKSATIRTNWGDLENFKRAILITIA